MPLGVDVAHVDVAAVDVAHINVADVDVGDVDVADVDVGDVDVADVDVAGDVDLVNVRSADAAAGGRCGWLTWLASSCPLLCVNSPPRPTTTSSHLSSFSSSVSRHRWGMRRGRECPHPST